MAISGHTGTVNGVCGNVVSWTLDITTTMLESTDFCSLGYREYVEGLTGATGTIVAYQRFTETTPISLGNSAGGTVYSGEVLWSSESVENTVDGIVTYTQGFTFNGAITIV